MTNGTNDTQALRRTLEQRRRRWLLALRFVERGLRAELVEEVDACYAAYGRAPLEPILQSRRTHLRLALADIREMETMSYEDLLYRSNLQLDLETRLCEPILTEGMIEDYLDESYLDEGGATPCATT